MKNGGLIRWNAITAFCENVQDLLEEGKTWYERRFGEPFKRPIIPFGAMVEYPPISTRDQSRLHQFGKKGLFCIFLGYELIAVRIWKEDMLIADLEELEKMDASEIYPRRIKRERSIDITKKEMKSYSQKQMVQQNCLEETTISEYPLQGRNLM